MRVFLAMGMLAIALCGQTQGLLLAAERAEEAGGDAAEAVKVQKAVQECYAICRALNGGSLSKKNRLKKVARLSQLLNENESLLADNLGYFVVHAASTSDARLREVLSDSLRQLLGGYLMLSSPWRRSRFADREPGLAAGAREVILDAIPRVNGAQAREDLLACLGRADWLRTLSRPNDEAPLLTRAVVSYAWERYRSLSTESVKSVVRATGGRTYMDRTVFDMVVRRTTESKDKLLIASFLKSVGRVFGSKRGEVPTSGEVAFQAEFVAQISKTVRAIAARRDLEASTRAHAKAIGERIDAFRRQCDTPAARKKEKEKLEEVLAKAKKGKFLLNGLHVRALESCIKGLDKDLDVFYLDIVKSYEKRAAFVDPVGWSSLSGVAGG
jgi:hypothetical protein